MPTGNTKNSDSRRSCTSLRCGTLFHRPNALCTPLPEILSLLRCSYHLPVCTNHTVQQYFLIIICDFTGFVNEFFVAEGFSLCGLLRQYLAPRLVKSCPVECHVVQQVVDVGRIHCPVAVYVCGSDLLYFQPAVIAYRNICHVEQGIVDVRGINAAAVVHITQQGVRIVQVSKGDAVFFGVSLGSGVGISPNGQPAAFSER